MSNFPAWVPLPESRGGGLCPISSLPRTALYKLTVACPDNDMKPPVISKVIKTPGSRRGRRMINVPSLLAWMDGQEAGGGKDGAQVHMAKTPPQGGFCHPPLDEITRGLP